MLPLTLVFTPSICQNDLETNQNPPPGVSAQSKKELAELLDGLEAFIVKNQDKNKEKLLPAGTPLNTEAPIQPKRKKSKLPPVPVITTNMTTGARYVSFADGHQSWENNGRQDGSHGAQRVASICGLIRPKSAQISYALTII